MSGFSITVSDRSIGTAVKALDGVTVRAIANARSTPAWASQRVYLTGLDQDTTTGRLVIRAWVLDEDDMADYRVTIDPQDLAGLVIL